MNSHDFSFNEDISQVVFARYDNSYNVDNMVQGQQGGKLTIAIDEPHISKMHLENMRKQGMFTIGVHKRIVSLQNHYENTTLNDHYIYEIMYLVDYF